MSSSEGWSPHDSSSGERVQKLQNDLRDFREQAGQWRQRTVEQERERSRLPLVQGAMKQCSHDEYQAQLRSIQQQHSMEMESQRKQTERYHKQSMELEALLMDTNERLKGLEKASSCREVEVMKRDLNEGSMTRLLAENCELQSRIKALEESNAKLHDRVREAEAAHRESRRQHNDAERRAHVAHTMLGQAILQRSANETTIQEHKDALRTLQKLKEPSEREVWAEAADVRPRRELPPHESPPRLRNEKRVTMTTRHREDGTFVSFNKWGQEV